MTGGPCDLHAAPRVYVASPIFTPEQLRTVGEVVGVLHEEGYVTYSPSRDGIMLSPADPPERRDEVFYSNVNAIQQSDLLIAILDVKDTGTIWELGAATGRGIPVIAVTFALKTMNVMLERGVIAHVANPHDLAEALRALRPFLLYGRKSTNDLRANEGQVLQYLKGQFSYVGQTQ
jgi:nucleoside 2-deoxyribosyltransferase